MTYGSKNRVKHSIFMRIEISGILHNSFTWRNSGSHYFSASTDY